jgi:hypothetical protein
MFCISFCQFAQSFGLTADQCFLLGAAPSLQLSFSGDSIRDAIEFLRKKTTVTGLRRAVYPSKVPALCFAILSSTVVRVLPT